MTTKNLELDFDLQTFALLDQKASIQASGGSIYISGSDTLPTESTTAPTEAVTDTYYTDTTVYYNFSGDNAAVRSDAVQISSGSAATYSYSAVDSDGGTTDTTVISSEPATANVTLSSPVWIQGGGLIASSDVSISGVGDVSLNTNSYIELTASGRNIALAGVAGEDVLVTPVSVALNHTINGAIIRASVASASNAVTLNGGSDGSAITIGASGMTTLSTIDNNQTWLLDTDKSLQLGNTNSAKVSVVASNAASVSGIDATGSYLYAHIDEGDSISLAASGSNAKDTISIDNTILSGAGTVQANVTRNSASEMVLTTGAQGALSVGASLEGGLASLASGAEATISVADSVPAITAVSKLANSGDWMLGSNVDTAVLGSDTVTFQNTGAVITANSGGTAVGGLSYSGNATLNGVGTHSAVSLNGSATWGIAPNSDTATFVAAFDSVGNINSVTNSEVTALTNNSGQNGAKTLTAGTAGDTLSLANGGVVTLNSSGEVTNASLIAGGTEWLVRGSGSNRQVAYDADGKTFTFQRATDSVFGALTADTAGGAISAVSSLTGNVTVGHTSSSTLSGLNVMGTSWTVANENGSAVTFDSLGTAASLEAASDSLIVSASSDASVNITATLNAVSDGYSLQGAFNGTTFIAHDGDGIVGVQLESPASLAGIAGITNLNSAATVIGDNHFSVNGGYEITKGVTSPTPSNVQVTLANGVMTVQNVVNNDVYDVKTTGRVIYDISSSVTSGGSAAVTIDGSPVSITANTSDSAIGNAYITANSDDAVVSVAGVKLRDTIATGTNANADKAFGVIYDTSSLDSETNYELNINSAKITLTSSDLVSGNDTLGVNVDTSNASMPRVTIASGIASSSTITAARGVYVIGGNAPATINEDYGFLKVNAAGGVTAEDMSVARENSLRSGAAASLIAPFNDENTTVDPYKQFYNAYYGDSLPFAEWNHTIAGYNAADLTATLSNLGDGVNIMGSDTLSSNPKSITLQSYLANPINVEHAEGRNGSATLNTAVIDVRGGRNSLIGLGMNTSDTIDPFSVNHTIFGSDNASTILVGPKATGNNAVYAGNGTNYIYHSVEDASSTLQGVVEIYGGTASDTIYAGPGDHVEGGGGKDYFFDASAVEISDYNFSEGDVIVATRLSNNTAISPEVVKVQGNKISIADGATITVGSNYQDNAVSARIGTVTNNRVSNERLFVWAGDLESMLDASGSEFTTGAYMFAQVNEDKPDTVIGSTHGDVIWAGPADSVDPGAGNDTIILITDTVSAGATIGLSAGSDNVENWKFGFSNSEGDNVLNASISELGLRPSNNGLIAYSTASGTSASLTFGASSTLPSYHLLVGGSEDENKLTYIGNGQTESVTSNDDFARYYRSAGNSQIYVSSDVNIAIAATLGSEQISGVNKLNINNNNKATIAGSSANESITVGGSADAGATKYVSIGGGNNNWITSGGNGDDAAGNYFYFGKYGGDTFSSGRTTLEGFSYWHGYNEDANYAKSDVLYLGSSADYGSLNVSSTRADINFKNSDQKVTLYDSTGFTGADKVLRVQFDDLNSHIYKTRIGINSGTNVNTFTYDGETEVYMGNQGRGRDILKVAANIDKPTVSIWLSEKDKSFCTDKDTYYLGIGAIDASNATGTNVSLVGNSSNNTITAGGEGTNNSLWGGGGEANTLIGGAGEDTFFYFQNYGGYTDNDGNPHSSKDTFDKVGSEDIIWLYDVVVGDDILTNPNAKNDIDFESTTQESGRINIALKNGTSLAVTNIGNETRFRVSNGTGWTDYKSINTGDRHWELA